MPIRTRKGATPAQSSPKRGKRLNPLKDITLKYIESQNSPVKPPLHKSKPAPKQRNSSSLPPSSPGSPISISSAAVSPVKDDDEESLPYCSSDRIDPEDIQRVQSMGAVQVPQDPEDDFEFSLSDELYLKDPAPISHQHQEDKLTNSDPFGFMGVERKLEQAIIKRTLLPPPDASLSSLRGRSAYPATPRKKGVKRLHSSSPDPFAVNQPLDEQPSSPLPLRLSIGKARESLATIVDLSMIEEDPVTPAPRRSTRRPAPKKRRDDSPVKVSSPPVRSTSPPSRVLRPVKVKYATGGVRQKTLKKTTSLGLRHKRRTRGGSNPLKKGQELEVSEEQERRIEYFKQLDDYSFSKEDVFVV